MNTVLQLNDARLPVAVKKANEKIVAEEQRLKDAETAPLDKGALRQSFDAELAMQEGKRDPVGRLEEFRHLGNRGHTSLELDLPLLAQLIGRETVLDRLVEIACQGAAEQGLSNEERAKRIGASKAKLRELYAEEERAILNAEKDGSVVVARRTKIDAGLVLKLWDNEVPGGSHKKLRALARTAKQFHSVVLGFADEYRAHLDRRTELENEIRRLEDGYHGHHDGEGYGANHLNRVRQELAETVDLMREASAVRDEAEQAWQAFSQPIETLMRHTGTGNRREATPTRSHASPDPDSPFARNAAPMADAALQRRGEVK